MKAIGIIGLCSAILLLAALLLAACDDITGGGAGVIPMRAF